MKLITLYFTCPDVPSERPPPRGYAMPMTAATKALEGQAVIDEADALLRRERSPLPLLHRCGPREQLLRFEHGQQSAPSERTKPVTGSNALVAVERHYEVDEIAKAWGLSPDTVPRVCRSEVGY